MTEEVAIETAIDTLVALNLDSLSDAQAEYTQLLAIGVLITAYTDNDINALTTAAARADLINAIDCIEKLMDLKTAEWVQKFQNA